MDRNGKVLLVVGALLAIFLVACGAMMVGGAVAYGAYRWLDNRGMEAGVVVEPEEWAEQLVTPAPEHRSEVFGALLVEVVAGTAADRAGLQPGELIVAVDGMPMDATHSLADLIGSYQPGDRVTLEVWRPGEYPDELQAVLGENPDQPGAPQLGVTFMPWQGPAEMPWPGVESEEWQQPSWTPSPRWQGSRGLVVVELIEGGPTDMAGVEVGDVLTQVDGAEVETRQDVIELLAQYVPGDKVVLTLFRHRNRQSREVTVTLGEHPDAPGMAFLGVSLGESMLDFELPGPKGLQEPQSFMLRSVPILAG